MRGESGLGERTGYAYSQDLVPERIVHAARTAGLIAHGVVAQPFPQSPLTLHRVRLCPDQAQAP